MSNRLLREQEHHDRQAQDRALTFSAQPELLRFRDEDYLNHETWVRPAFQALEPLKGHRALDLGCGHGMASVVMARRGAEVTALDLSSGYLAEAQLRAQANGVAARFVHSGGEHLPFANASFDRIWGNAILHHLDLFQAAPELARVLAPGGIAVFCEPWGENPLVRWARQWLPYRGKGHTPDEEPLRQRHLTEIRRSFPEIELRGFQMLSMLRRAMPVPLLQEFLEGWDQVLLKSIPAMSKFCRYVVLTLRK